MSRKAIPLPAADSELARLIESMCDGTLTPLERDRLESLLADDRDAKLYYVAYMDLHAQVQWLMRDEGLGARLQNSDTAEQPSASDCQPPTIAPIIIDASPTLHSPLLTLHSPLGGFLFSYTTAALILGLGLLIGWACKVSYQAAEKADVDYAVGEADSNHRMLGIPPYDRRQQASATLGAAEAPVVGQVTGTADCRWVDATMGAVDGDRVSVGHTYALASGFIEITYDGGAKVILQGPCRYAIESAHGGFLSLGRLTARVEKRAEGEVGTGQWAVGSKSELRNPNSEMPSPPSALRLPPSDRGAWGERTANLSSSSQRKGEPTTSLAPRPSVGKSEIRNPKSEISNLQSPIPNPLFSVRTPTAIITDLGTEFGVEVDRSGASRAHVFQGKVELQPTQRGKDSHPIRLGANESARVEKDQGRGVRVIREAGRSNTAFTSSFTRQMPDQARITAFSTGMGLREGDPDPHWQVAARSDDPHFQPRPAVVTAAGPKDMPNDPSESQWISIGNGPPPLSNGVTLTFRTTCLFRGTAASGRKLNVKIRLLANKRVKAIRVNGKTVQALDAAVSAGRTVFSWEDAIHEGVNRVEFDVTNEDRSQAGGVSPILLKVTWH